MASQAIDSHRQNAEIYHGDAVCKKKFAELLKEVGLPRGLLPLVDVEEVGYDRAAGFLWMVQKKKRKQNFKAIKRTVSYDTEVTALVEGRRMKKITGVKAKELLQWRSVAEISADDPSSGKITFKTGAGLSESFPMSAFEPDGLGREQGKAARDHTASMIETLSLCCMLGVRITI